MKIVLAMRIQSYVKNGCVLFLCEVQRIEKEDENGEVPAISEFPDVLPEAISGIYATCWGSWVHHRLDTRNRSYFKCSVYNGSSWDERVKRWVEGVAGKKGI